MGSCWTQAASNIGEDDGHEGEHGNDMETEGGVEAGGEGGGGSGRGSRDEIDLISDGEEGNMGELGQLNRLWVELESRVQEISSKGYPNPPPGNGPSFGFDKFYGCLINAQLPSRCV